MVQTQATSVHPECWTLLKYPKRATLASQLNAASVTATPFHLLKESTKQRGDFTPRFGVVRSTESNLLCAFSFVGCRAEDATLAFAGREPEKAQRGGRGEVLELRGCSGLQESICAVKRCFCAASTLAKRLTVLSQEFHSLVPEHGTACSRLRAVRVMGSKVCHFAIHVTSRTTALALLSSTKLLHFCLPCHSARRPCLTPCVLSAPLTDF